MSLVDFHSMLEAHDEEMSKMAADEDAAGRITARGFMDELEKLAQGSTTQYGPLQSLLQAKPVSQPKKTGLGGPGQKRREMSPTGRSYWEPLPKERKKLPATPKHPPHIARALAGRKKPPVTGAMASGSVAPSAAESAAKLRYQMAAAKPPKRKATMMESLKTKGKRARQSVEEAGRSYGKAFAGFGRGLARAARGE